MAGDPPQRSDDFPGPTESQIIVGPEDSVEVDDPGPLEKWFDRHKQTILVVSAVISVTITIAIGVLISGHAARNSYDATIEAKMESVRTDLRRLEDRLRVVESLYHGATSSKEE